MRKGNSHNSRNGLDRGVSVPGAFKLDHLQPVKPILFPKFSNFFTFILEANSYYPREWKAENGEIEFSHSVLEKMSRAFYMRVPHILVILQDESTEEIMRRNLLLNDSFFVLTHLYFTTRAWSSGKSASQYNSR